MSQILAGAATIQPRDARAGLWVLLGVILFGLLAFAASSGASADLDERILLSLRTPGDLDDPMGPQWLEEAARDVTALGGTALIAGATILVALSALLNNHARLAAFAVLTVGLGQIASELLKQVFERPRPDLVPHEVVVYSASLPSGHSMMAAVTFFTLAFVIARERKKRRNRFVIFAAAALLTVLVGASRVYLGVHWPTDVLAGWCAGVAWAGAASFAYARWVARAPDA